MVKYQAEITDVGGAGGSPRTDEIRSVAAELFRMRGYSATTMTSIADAAGVFPGSLYHHFASKEEIAVDLLERFVGDLHGLSLAFPASGAVPPEERLLMLVAESMALSQRHAAAIRLRTFEPPTVATERLHAARERRVPALDLAWQTAVDDLDPRAPGREGHAALLRLTLQDMSHVVASMLPISTDPFRMARNTTEILLRGIAFDTPDDAELDGSVAMAAADDAIARWPGQHDSAATDERARIVQVAKAEFARRGYDATTIRDVAQAGGIRMGTLYRRVKSKDELAGEIISAFNQQFGAAVSAVFAAGDSTVATLDAIAKVFIRGRSVFHAEAEISRFGWRAGTPGTPFGLLRLQGNKRLEVLVAVMDRGIAGGSLRRIDDSVEIGPLLRYICWTPPTDLPGIEDADRHQFIRESVLRGYARRSQEA